MAFLETIEDYDAKVRKFAKEHPDVTEDDLKALFPRMNSVADIWAKFNGSAKRGAGGRKAANA